MQRSMTHEGALLGDGNIGRNEKYGPDQRALIKEVPPGLLADKELEEDGRGVKQKKKSPDVLGNDSVADKIEKSRRGNGVDGKGRVRLLAC